jgi:hypothetical protein
MDQNYAGPAPQKCFFMYGEGFNVQLENTNYQEDSTASGTVAFTMNKN